MQTFLNYKNFPGTMYYPNKDRYIGEFINDREDGIGIAMEIQS